MKAYKVFNEDWICKGYQYKVGETYTMTEKPELCRTGFHACKRAIDGFSYYSFNPKTKVAEVELLGDIVGENEDKQATNKIKIVREILWPELLDMVNTGKGNTGHSNSGDSNSGYSNSGYSNSGDRNSGYSNSGDRNSGYSNSGDRNSGYSNSGDWNSGDRNSGYSNSGDWNSGHYHTGYFNSKNAEKHYIFNQLVTTEEKDNFLQSEGVNICKRFRLIKYRVTTQTCKNGDYRYMSYKSSWRYFWNNLTFAERNAIRNMPYFDKRVFEEITGVKA